MESAARTRSQPTTHLIDVIVLTTDPALLATLREASGPSHQLLHAQSADAAVELLVNGHHGILILDVAVVGTRDVTNLVDKLQAQFPEILLLATGRRDEQNAVAGLVGSGRIYRFLHKPVSPARAELFLSAATRRYGELQPQASRAALAVRTLRRTQPRNFVVIGVALALLAGGAWLWSQRHAQPALPVAAPTSPPAADSTATLLGEANAARAAGRLAPPAANNAFDLYRSVLRADPANAKASAAIRDIATALEGQVASALSASDLQAAQDGIESLTLVAPQNERLAALQKQLAELTTPRKPAQAPASTNVLPPAAASAAPPAPVPTAVRRNTNVQLAKAFLAANQLVEPEDASALGQLRHAREAREDPGAIRITATDLGTQLLNRALAAITAGDIEQARAAYDSAVTIDREFDTSLPDLDLVARQLQELRSARQTAALRDRVARVSKLRTSGQLIEPAGDNAYELLQTLIKDGAESPDVGNERQQLSFALLERTRTALAAGDVDQADVLATRAEETLPGLPQTKVLRQAIGEARQRRDDASALVQAANLVRRRETPAVYPRDALLRGTEGWVDLEFTITAAGEPENLVVKAATPPRVFDNAALIALRQWRFEPIIRDGAPRAQRATLRMEFRLQD